MLIIIYFIEWKKLSLWNTPDLGVLIFCHLWQIFWDKRQIYLNIIVTFHRSIEIYPFFYPALYHFQYPKLKGNIYMSSMKILWGYFNTLPRLIWIRGVSTLRPKTFICVTFWHLADEKWRFLPKYVEGSQKARHFHFLAGFLSCFLQYISRILELIKLDQGPIDRFCKWIEVRLLCPKPFIFSNPYFLENKKKLNINMQICVKTSSFFKKQ